MAKYFSFRSRDFRLSDYTSSYSRPLSDRLVGELYGPLPPVGDGRVLITQLHSYCTVHDRAVSLPCVGFFDGRSPLCIVPVTLNSLPLFLSLLPDVHTCARYRNGWDATAISSSKSCPAPVLWRRHHQCFGRRVVIVRHDYGLQNN